MGIDERGDAGTGAGSRRPRRRPSDFAWQGHEEVVTYVVAAVTYVSLGVATRTVVLNWIAGPLFFTIFVWAASCVLSRRGVRRR